MFERKSKQTILDMAESLPDKIKNSQNLLDALHQKYDPLPDALDLMSQNASYYKLASEKPVDFPSTRTKKQENEIADLIYFAKMPENQTRENEASFNESIARIFWLMLSTDPVYQNLPSNKLKLGENLNVDDLEKCLESILSLAKFKMDLKEHARTRVAYIKTGKVKNQLDKLLPDEVLRQMITSLVKIYRKFNDLMRLEADKLASTRGKIIIEGQGYKSLEALVKKSITLDTKLLIEELQSNVVYETKFIRRLLQHSLTHFSSLDVCHQ